MRDTYRDSSIIVALEPSLPPKVIRQANPESTASLLEICSNLEKEHINEMLLHEEASKLENWELDAEVEVRNGILTFARACLGSIIGAELQVASSENWCGVIITC